HRAAPVVLPARVVAAFAAEGEWSVLERRYLEAAFANAWIAEGTPSAQSGRGNDVGQTFGVTD
ncbi:MAG: hypothetical protein WBA73_03150, partial [Devosia sp.]